VSESVRSLRKFMLQYSNEIHLRRESILDEARQYAETQEVLLPFLLLFVFIFI
jgi:hypothetical protein